MITENTVFILGAGASYPYGLPLAKELRRQICFDFVPYYENLIGNLKSVNTQQGEELIQRAREFVDAFFKSSDPSIDVWLVKNPSFMEIGKEAIISMILRGEYKGGLREKAPHHDQDWYSHLWRRMTDEFTIQDDYKRFSGNNVDFITFNYDRSLDKFLFESLTNAFHGISSDDAVKQLNQRKLIHLYGQIAPLKWQGSLDRASYGEHPDEFWPKKYVDNLKIIYEAENTPEVEQARELVKKAQRIFFLGFGYAKENLEILQLPNIIGSQRIYGTAFGLSSTEISRITHRLEIGATPIIEPWDCLRLLKEHL